MDFLQSGKSVKPLGMLGVHSLLAERIRDIAPDSSAVAAMLSMESMTAPQLSNLKSTAGRIETAIESMRSELNISTPFTEAQKSAAVQAGLMAFNLKGMVNRTLRPGFAEGSDSQNTFTLENFSLSDSVSTRQYLSAESYDERDNRNAVCYSITYNLQASRQDDFGESLYATLAVPGDQAAITVTSNLMYVMDNVERNVSGATYDFKRKNLLRAVADATVLRKDQTRAVPVYRAQAAASFVDTAVIAPVTIQVDAEPVTTAPLAFNKSIDLLGLSQTDAMLENGTQNQTDTLDPTVTFTAFYVKVGAQVLKIPTLGIPYFNFVPNAQQDYKMLTLSADTTSVLFNNQTTAADGSPLAAALAQIVSGNLILRMHTVINGNVRTDLGNVSVYPGVFEVSSIQVAGGDFIALTDPSVAALVTALNGAQFLGYDVLAYRSNQNRRQQGQFVDVAKQFQRYIVPLRSPITTRHPAHTDGQTDGSDVQALITATRIRIANEAVTSILQAIDTLRLYVDSRDTSDEGPEVLGVGRYYLRPTTIIRNFDAFASVDSQKSYERALDIQGALMNQIRDMVYELYRDSEYKAGSDALYGGVGPMPKVILATDQYTARYLNMPGDLRTLGGEFQYQVVSTLDYRFRGKIVIAFVVQDGSQNTSVNPLNNGNLLWAPELVLTANIGRGGQFSRETLVQPRYLFIQNTPVLGLLTVENIPDVLGKVPLNFDDVTP